jgi:hypothetical protein
MSVKKNKFATLQPVALCTFAALWFTANGAELCAEVGDSMKG